MSKQSLANEKFSQFSKEQIDAVAQDVRNLLSEEKKKIINSYYTVIDNNTTVIITQTTQDPGIITDLITKINSKNDKTEVNANSNGYTRVTGNPQEGSKAGKNQNLETTVINKSNEKQLTTVETIKQTIKPGKITYKEITTKKIGK